MKNSFRKNIEDIFALTPVQEGILFHYLKEPESRFYYEQLSLELSGEIDPERFENAWNFVIETNEMLRAVFRWEAVEHPIQVILKEYSLRPEYYDLSGVKENLRDLKASDRDKKFDLREVPFRLTLCKIGESQYKMIITNHHILYDGWSNGIILHEFFETYNALVSGKELAKPVKGKFKDFIKWNQNRDNQKQGVFWRTYLSGVTTKTELSIKNRKREKGSDAVENFCIHPGLAVKKELDRFIKKTKITLASLLYTAWGILLQKYNDTGDVVFGTTVSGRSRSAVIKGIEDIVGLFINTVPLRVQSVPGEKIFDQLYRVDDALLTRAEHETTPPVKINEYSELNGGEELFDSIVVIENYPLADGLTKKSSPLYVRSYAMSEATHYDLTVCISVFEDFKLDFNFRKELFDKEHISWLADHLINVMKKIVTDPTEQLEGMEIVSEEEKRKILDEFNHNRCEFPETKTVYELFEEAAVKRPGKTVLIYGNTHLTFRELNRGCNRLAAVLRSRGVIRESIVAMTVPRSIEMVVGLIAILKAGGAYLPIDAGSPPERIRFILGDCRARLLLTKGKTDYGDEFDGNVLDMKEEILKTGNNGELGTVNIPWNQANPADPAYVIYTSGSTGRPKGTLVRHVGVVNILFNLEKSYPLGEDGVYLLKTNFMFDVSVTEIFGWFFGTGRLAILAVGKEGDPDAISGTVRRYRVTHINFVPSMLSAFLDGVGDVTALKYVFVAGEAFPVSIAERAKNLNPSVTVENIYGPTEATIYAAAYSLKSWKGMDIVPIGKPLPNISLYILGKDNRIQPVGVPGELCISGIGVARGYLNNPELTAQRYSHNRSYKTHRTYKTFKTGDRARWLPDGNIEFLGRMDHQVKIRGFRVEPGEIENRLLKHGKIKETVVTEREADHGSYLCAYIVADSEIPLSVGQLKDYLSRHLPDYMIPVHFVFLDKMPLNQSGKLDRNGLPEPDIAHPRGTYIAPRDQKEKTLAEIWSQLLGVKKELIGIDHNFFELGGHSLKAITLAAKIHKRFNVNILLSKIFDVSTIRALADYIKRTAGDTFKSMAPVKKKDYYALSSAQSRLYLLQQMAEESTGYNMTEALELEGVPDKNRLEETFARLIRRHESLRTSFHMVGEDCLQKIHAHDEIRFKIEYREFSGSPTSIIKEFVKPFNLEQAPLFRVGLVKLHEDRHLLTIGLHHIISDGTSIEILVRDFTALYDGVNPPELKLQYKDYAEWQIKEKGTERIVKQEEYWLRQFEGEIPVLDLPTDFTRPSEQSFEGSFIAFEISKEKTGALKEFGMEEGATLYMVLLAVISVLLSKLGNREDLVIGTPTAGRVHEDLEHIIGMFVNTMPIRNRPAGEKTFKAFLEEVRNRTLGAYENQEYPFEDLVEAIDIKRDHSRNPLFDVMFVLQNMDRSELKIPGLTLKRHKHENRTAKFDLNFMGTEIGGKLLFDLEYCTKLFTEETVLRFSRYLKQIVDVVIANPGIRLRNIEITDPGERKKILEFSTGTAEAVDGYCTIHKRFEAKAKTMEAETALVSHGESLGYGDLNKKSGQLANLLRAKGVRANRIVGLMAERSFEMIIGMFGIMKAGGAYLPIDPEYPEERKRYMIEDSGIDVLLTNDDLSGTEGFIPGNIEVIDLRDKNIYSGDVNGPECVDSGSNLIYMIYTSGSTGNPKGAMIEHKNVVNLMQHQFNHTNIDFCRVLQFTTISFDVSTQEIFSTLLAGGILYLIDKDTRGNVPELFRYIEENEITTLFIPASFLKFVLGVEEYIALIPACIKHIVSAGEQMVVTGKFRDYIRSNNVYMHNHYGPTETHVVTALTLAPDGPLPELPSIGRPMINVGIYLLDENMRLQPIGVPGELYIGGNQVGRGYLGREELTTEKFIPNPFLHGDRLYRTGDIAKWLPDGNIAFLGRKDHQVKIRGFRVEPEEIETHLMDIDFVKEAVVLARGGVSGEKYLCAYIVSHRLFEGHELRHALAAKLPDYMIPSYFVPMDNIPLTPSKKVDKNALPEPRSEGRSTTRAAPGDEIEKKLALFWEDILKARNIGIDDDFFDLGGHSLKANILKARVSKEFNVEFPLSKIFSHSTVRRFADYVKTLKSSVYEDIKPVEKQTHYPLSSAQKRLYILSRMEKPNVVYNLAGIRGIEGELDKSRIEKAFHGVLRRHESLRTSFALKGGEAAQIIHENVNFEIEDIKIPHPQNREETVAAAERFVRPFNLGEPPLIRIGIARIEEKKHLLFFDMHHIISDGVSMAVLTRDLIYLYEGKELPTLPVQYKDFSQWQNALLESEAIGKQRRYWLDLFKDGIPALKMMTDNPRPPVQCLEGDNIIFHLDNELTSRLNRLAKETGTTLYMVLLSIYNVLFFRYTGQEDIVVGLPIAGRNHTDLENIIGFFVNTLAMRNYPMGDKSFEQFLEEVKGNALDAYENQDYPFDELVNKLNIPKDLSRNPIFDVMFVLQNMERMQEFEHLKMSTYDYIPGISHFDLHLHAVEDNGMLRMTLEYSTALFNRSTVKNITNHYIEISRQVVEDKETRLEDFEISQDFLIPEPTLLEEDVDDFGF